MRNAAIVGAGLLGRLLAWRLARQGVQVTLFEKDDRSGRSSAGYVAAAMLAPYSELLNAEPVVFAKGREGFAIWRRWLDELTGETGLTVPIQFRGSVVVAHTQDASELNRFSQRLQAQSCVPKEQLRWLDAQALAALEPELASKFRQGLYLPDEGCVGNWQLYEALFHALEYYRVEWCQEAVLDMGELVGRYEQVIDCRGFGAKGEFDGLRGVRGEVLWVRAPEVRLSRPVRLMHPRYQLYIAPKPNDIYVIGATEIESESLAPITVRSGLELQSALYSVHTGFSEANVLEAFANLRPAFADNLPRIESCPGLMRINGLYRHGYLLSPVVVSTVESLLLGAGQMLWPEIVVI